MNQQISSPSEADTLEHHAPAYEPQIDGPNQ